MGYRPIREYAIVGNDDRFALVDRNGSIDWCCFPHGAAPSVFARLLDDEGGGHFAVRPTDTYTTERRYLDRTNVLETAFETRSGRATLTDFMPTGGGDGPDRHQHAVYRRVRCTDGSLSLESEFNPRLNYARADTTVERSGRGFVATGDDERLHLHVHGDFEARVASDRVVGVETVSEGDSLWFVLQYGRFTFVSPENCLRALEETIRYWRTWADDLLDVASPIVDGHPWRDAVLRSGLVLKLLTNEETGAIYAAATTSLPEEYGGDRNWDYRYNWIRDAKFTIQALHNLGRTDEAHAYFEWFREIGHETAGEIQPVYGVHGEADIPERELDHLTGYRHSFPVRIGNAAAKQSQHDIYGTIVQAFYETLRHDEPLTESDWETISALVEHVCEVWDERDDGIWEFRDEPRHYVHSKLLCWVALDRGIELARQLPRDTPIDRWRAERAALEEAILERGYSETVGSFVQHFETTDALDATSLLIPIHGLLPPEDERVEATLDTVLDQLLTDERLLYRTKNSEAVDDERSTFVFCTFWLVDALVLAGRIEEADDIFSNVLDYATPLGLLSERIDPETGELLGNFPQVFSHLGLLNSAIYLAGARAGDEKLVHDPHESDVDVRPLFRK